ncbi:MAG: hypothetical protein R3236_05855 [Phycisphaeraceae bacterium]|nr:hypothetical protein [Phycisphaeraceae bacterium]
MSEGETMTAEERLNRSLQKTGSLHRWVKTSVCAIDQMLWLFGAAVAAAVVDALWAPAETGLWLIIVLLVSVAVVSAAKVWWCWSGERFIPGRVARLIERRLGWTDSILISAVQLADAPAGASPALCRLALQRGAERAATFDPVQVVRADQLWTRGRWLIGLVLAVGLLHAMVPGLMGAAAARLFNPSAELPAYTPIRFEIQIDPRPVEANRPLTVRVRTEGPALPEEAALVWAESGEPNGRQSLAMVPEGRGTFSLRLNGPDRPVRFFIQTASGRSGWIDLEPIPKPSWRRTELQLVYPSHTGWADREMVYRSQTLRMLAGTQLRIEAEATRPLASVRWVDPTGRRLEELSARVEGTAAHVKLKPQQSGVHRLIPIGRDGVVGEALDLTLEVSEDRPPVVRLIEPDRRMRVPVGWSVPVRVDIEDDLRVGRVELDLNVAGRLLRREMALSRSGPTRATAEAQIDLKQLGLVAGDVIRGRARGYDRRPGGGVAVPTAPFELRVIALSEYRKQIAETYSLRQMFQEIDRWLVPWDRMASTRKQLVEAIGRDDAASALAAHRRAKKSMAGLLNSRLAREPIDPLDETINRRLGPLANRLSAAQKVLADAAEGIETSGRPPATLRPYLLRRQAEAEADRRVLVAVRDQLAAVVAMAELASVAGRLGPIAGQQEKLIEPLRRGGSKSSLGRTQQELADSLQRVLDDLKDLADAHQRDAAGVARTARFTQEAIQKLKVRADQLAAAKAARQGDWVQAAAAAQRASNKLQSLEGEQTRPLRSGWKLPEGPLALSRAKVDQSIRRELSRRPPSAAAGGRGWETASVAGPHTPRAPVQGLGATDAQRPDSAAGFSGEPSVQVLEAETRSSGPAVGMLPEAPPLYRSLVEAYLRRLAEEPLKKPSGVDP